jgi:hypothetical protein
MSARPGIVLALTPLAERQVESLIFDADAPLELLGSVVIADDLDREISEQTPTAVLLSPELSGLTSGHCERARAAGVRLVGLALDQHERGALDALRVDTTIDTGVSRDELLAALVVHQPPTPQPPNPTLVIPPRSLTAARERGEDRGSVVAVLGVRGAPGASELACSLAALATQRWETLLVEVDALAGNGLAARLGADPAAGSLLGLIRATQAGEGALRELVERWLIQPEEWPAVLLGAPDAQALSEITQPGAITAALDALSSLYPVVVCDIALPLSDTHGPVHVHREALLAADAVLLVLGAREPQLHGGLRTVDVLLDALAIPAERLRILVGQTGAAASASKTAIANTITGHLADRGLAIDGWLAWDARGARRAQRHGRPIALARRHGAYARAVRNLLDELFIATPSSSPKAKRSKRRLPAPTHTDPDQPHDEVIWQR